MRAALNAPRRKPKAIANAIPDAQLPPPRDMTASAVRYWTTDAPTANEMSMPPATSTTRSPAAKMRLMALMLRRSNRLTRVRKVSVARPSTAQMTTMTRRSHPSVEAGIGSARRGRG